MVKRLILRRWWLRCWALVMAAVSALSASRSRQWQQMSSVWLRFRFGQSSGLGGLLCLLLMLWEVVFSEAVTEEASGGLNMKGAEMIEEKRAEKGGRSQRQIE